MSSIQVYRTHRTYLVKRHQKGVEIIYWIQSEYRCLSRVTKFTSWQTTKSLKKLHLAHTKSLNKYLRMHPKVCAQVPSSAPLKEGPDDRWIQCKNDININVPNTFYNYMSFTLTNMSQIGELGACEVSHHSHQFYNLLVRVLCCRSQSP